MILALGIGTYVLSLGGRFTFFFDEWSFVFDRDLNLHSLLESHNGHLSTLAVLIYVGILKIVGMGAYLPFRVVVIASHLAACLGAYLIVSRRRGWPLGFMALVTLGLLGSGWQNILWSFQFSTIAPVALAFFGIWLLEVNKNPDAKVAALVGAGLAFSGGGVPVIVGFIVHAVVVRAWRRLAMLTAVASFFALWLVTMGDSVGSSRNIERIPRFVFDSAIHSAAGIGGRGSLMAVAVGLVAFAGFIVNRRQLPTAPAFVVPIATLASGWVITAYSRADIVGPDASRYVYVGAAFLIVLVLILVPWPTHAAAVALLLPVTVWIVHPNIALMRENAAVFAYMADEVRAELGVIESYGPMGNDGYRPIPDYAPQITAGEYLAAARKYGSVGIDAARLSDSSVDTKVRLDRVAFQYAQVRVEPFAAPDVESCEWSKVPRGSVIELGSSEVLVKHSRPVSLALRMFADEASDTTRLAIEGTGVSILTAPTRPHLPAWRFATNHMVEIGICGGLGAQG